MQIELTENQLSYLKGLDSKKKKRKFLLDCILENIDLETSSFFSKDYVKSENESTELVNSTDEIKEILVVDFENVSETENPQ